MVKDNVSLVTFPNPMVTSGVVLGEVFVLFPLSAAAIVGMVELSRKIKVINSVFCFCID